MVSPMVWVPLQALLGDKYSLGFVAETERQVSQHLQQHLQQLPEHDERSRKILEQMNEMNCIIVIQPYRLAAWIYLYQSKSP